MEVALPAMKTSVAWIGGYPAHYVKELHRRIEEVYSDRVHFFYLELTGRENLQRHYEKGELPNNSTMIKSDNVLHQSLCLVKALRRLNPKMIITAGHYPWPLLIASAWGQVNGFQVCYWSDTNLFDIFATPLWWQAAKRLAFKLYLHKMFRCLYIGSQNRAFYAWCYGTQTPIERLIWFPYPHDPSPFHNNSRNGQLKRAGLGLGDNFVFLYLGRLVPTKGVDRLIKALALLPDEVLAHCSCLIAGDGPCCAELQALVRDLGLEGSVMFLGTIPSNETPPLFAAADVVVLPSHEEPWGVVVNEALSSGKPVVVSYWVGAAADLVLNGVTGVVMPSNSPEHIASAFLQLYDDQERSRRMGIQGLELVTNGGWNIDNALSGWKELMKLAGSVPSRSGSDI
jgi:glycosyltransferase involved in cell wall biosynthesis